MLPIISHLECVCVSVCTQALEVPLVMHSEICPAAVPLSSCSLLKGSLSSSAPIPLKTYLSVSVCFSLFSLHISFGVFCWFMLMYFHLFRKRLYMDLQPGYTSQIALNPMNLCTLCLLDSCYLSVPTEKAFSCHRIFPPNAYYSTTHSLEIFKSSLYITEVCVQVSLMPLAPHFEQDLEFDLYSVT